MKALQSTFTWVAGQKVWIEYQPMVEARVDDYLKTREHKVIEKLSPERWGGDGAAS